MDPRGSSAGRPPGSAAALGGAGCDFWRTVKSPAREVAPAKEPKKKPRARLPWIFQALATGANMASWHAGRFAVPPGFAASLRKRGLGGGTGSGHGARCPPFRGDAPVLVLPGPVAGANRLGLPQGAGLGRKIKRRRGRRLSGGRPHRLGQRLRGDFHRDRVRGSHHLPIAHTRLFRLLLPINAWSFHFQFPGGFLCLSLRNRSETAGINHRATGDSSVSFWKKTPEGQDFF